MALTTITPPSVEPLLVSDDAFKAQHLRVDHDEDDGVLAEYIAAARVHVEAYTRRRLITQAVRLTLDGFGCDGRAPVLLPVAPVQSVDVVRYMDRSGTWQVLAADQYRLTASRQPVELWPIYGTAWPVPRLDAAVVEIDMTVGYGAAGSDVEPQLLQALRMLVAHWYENRAAASIKAVSPVPMGVEALLNPHRFWV